MATFETAYRVRFHDVDHAGIIFFARIIQYCHDALEDLQREAGIPLETFFEERELGAPLVDVHARFERPFRHGDLLRIHVGFERLGAHSTTTRFVCYDAEDRRCATVRFVQAMVHTGDLAVRPLPDDVRSALERYRVEPEDA